MSRAGQLARWATIGGFLLALAGLSGRMLVAQQAEPLPTVPTQTVPAQTVPKQTAPQQTSRGKTIDVTPVSLMEPPIVGPGPQVERDQEKRRNADRQRQLVLDTQKLVALAGELKVVVDKSNKDTLSLDVIRKADEMEKLARSVKEKMKGY